MRGIKFSFIASLSVIIATCALLLLAVPSSGQEVPFQEHTEVEITNVDVFVRDGDGNPVTGLGRDDFVVYEDGERRELTNFAEYSLDDKRGDDEAWPSADPARFVILIENRALNQFSRDDVLDATGRGTRGPGL